MRPSKYHQGLLLAYGVGVGSLCHVLSSNLPPLLVTLGEKLSGRKGKGGGRIDQLAGRQARLFNSGHVFNMALR